MISSLMTRLVRRWSMLVFGEHSDRITPRIRMFRLLEEVLELAQAEGVILDEIDAIVNQVYERPVGVRDQEFGGVMICLMAYADTTRMDPEECFWAEFERIMDPAIMDRVRQRNLSGDKIGMVAHDL